MKPYFSIEDNMKGKVAFMTGGTMGIGVVRCQISPGLCTFQGLFAGIQIFRNAEAAFGHQRAAGVLQLALVALQGNSRLLALPGDSTAMWLASSWPRWWYIRYAARCIATLVLPEPAPPITDRTRALSCRIAMFCSC